MLRLLPFFNAYSHTQKAGSTPSLLRKGGKKKERVVLAVSGVNLKDNLCLEKMRYAVAGKLVTREEAFKQLNKKGFQKNVVIPIAIPKADGSLDAEQQFLLLNYASFAKRHGLNLWKAYRVAKASNKAMREGFLNQVSTFPENSFAQLAEQRIREEGEAQEIIQEACRTLKFELNQPQNNLSEVLKQLKQKSSSISDKKLRKDFQALLKKINHAKAFSKEILLERFMDSLGWKSTKSKENPHKDFNFHTALWDVMQEVPSISGKGDIVLSSCVMGDGKGDYVHLTNMAKKLHKMFPDRKIHLIVVADTRHQENGLRLLDKEICSTHIAYESLGLIAGKKIIDNPFESDLGELIKKSDLWISGPVPIVGIYDGYHKEALKGIEYTEYDAEMVSRDFGLKLSLGLSSLGVFTKKPRNCTWDKIESKVLKESLFNSQTPSQKEIEGYLAQNTHLICYQSLESFLGRFVNRAVEFSLLQDPDKDIDITVPGQKRITEKMLRDQCDLAGLKAKGFSEVKYIYYENDQQQELLIPIQKKGKVLRIIDPGFLSQKDFKSLSYLSSPLMGCTGDHALALALSYGKVPQYEMPGHKKRYYLKLREISDEKFGKDSDLSQFLNHQPIKNPSAVVEQAKELGEKIRKEHSFNRYLKGVVNQRLLHSKDPDFKQFEEQLYRSYLSGLIPLKEIPTQIKNELKRIGYLP